MLRAVLKQPNLEPPWPRGTRVHGTHPMHTSGQWQETIDGSAIVVGQAGSVEAVVTIYSSRRSTTITVLT